MKKILFTLLLLLCTTVGWAVEIVDGYYQVSNLQELKEAIDATKDGQGKSTSKIKLTDNIFLDGMESTLCETFAGEIDGKYTLKNNKGKDVDLMHVIHGSSLAEVNNRKKCSYLFTFLEDATIKNVAFKNIRVDSDTDDNFGVIAAIARRTTFEQVTVDNCSVWTDKNYAGAIVGQAIGCKFHVVFVNSCDVTVDGIYAGGFVGYSEKNVYTYGGACLGTAVFADGNNAENAGWSGGIAGYSKNDHFFFMTNLALVGADQNFVGGYAGESVGSNFVRCQNSGAVLQIDETDSDPKKSFRDQHQAMLDYISKHKSEWTTKASGFDEETKLFAYMLNVGGDSDVNKILDLPDQPLTRFGQVIWIYPVNYVSTDVGLFEVLATNSYFTPLVPEGETVVKLFAMSANAEAAEAGTCLSFGAACGIAAAVAVVVIAAVISIYIFNGDDEVGGICGKATGCFFEQCTNNATLSCRDDNCGGIVGLGKGVVINNCLNTGKLDYDEISSSGSILGQADVDSNGMKCMVTNCFSTTALQIIGSWNIEEGVDEASGNNYRWLGSDDTTCNWEMAVPAPATTSELYMNGKQIGYLLNNGVENRRAGIAPWRYEGNLIFANPSLEPSFNEITVESLPHVVEISSARQLLDFAAAVNDGDQFKVGILTADIVMPAGQKWTPIGQYEKDTDKKEFRGIFDGQGHTISGLVVDNINSENQGAGLFGVVNANAIIRNVIVKNSTFSNAGNGGAGGIVGRVSTGRYSANMLIENCGSYANVNANQNGGGIVGRVSTGDNGGPSVNVYVENCFNCGTVTAQDGKSALLCGYVKNHGHIRNCWSAGKLTSNTSTKPFDDANNEMFVGYESKLDIENCYVAGADVMGAGQNPQTGVKSYIQSVLANGHLTYMLNGNTNDVTKSLTWQQNLGTDEAPVFGNKGLYHTRTVSNEYGTACLPYALKSDEAIRYYTFQDSSDATGDIKLSFNYAETVEPGTPVLFKAAATGDVTFCSAADGLTFSPVAPASSADWKFNGTFEQCDFSDSEVETKYYVSSGAIKHSTKTLTIAPYRAYFEGPNFDEITGSTGSSAKSIRLVLGDENGTTELELISDDLMPVQEGAKAYNLFGTEAGEGYRGIVIRGGKKVMMQ